MQALLIASLNLLLLAPVSMQILHLLLADVVWIAFVLMSASALAKPGTTSVKLLTPFQQGSN